MKRLGSTTKQCWRFLITCLQNMAKSKRGFGGRRHRHLDALVFETHVPTSIFDRRCQWLDRHYDTLGTCSTHLLSAMQAPRNQYNHHTSRKTIQREKSSPFERPGVRKTCVRQNLDKPPLVETVLYCTVPHCTLPPCLTVLHCIVEVGSTYLFRWHAIPFDTYRFITVILVDTKLSQYLSLCIQFVYNLP